MRSFPVRTVLSGLLVVGFFSCKPTPSADTQAASELDAVSESDGASFALANPKEPQDMVEPCPTDKKPNTEVF